MPAREHRPVTGILAFLALTLFMAVISGVVYERAGRLQDRKRFPRIGRAVDIGGRSLNIYCSGAGNPAVIFESRTPLSGYTWVYIQREVAKFTRACWYDRAGYGWSDPAPNPRNGRAIANDLHELLRTAGLPPRYILVGATFGALYARIYQKLYPADVAGLILVQPFTIAEVTDPRTKGSMPRFLHYPQSLLAQGFNQIGLVRLFELGAHGPPSESPPQGLTPQEWSIIWGLRNEPKTRVALLQELVTDFAAEDRATGTPAGLPVTVLNSEDVQFSAPEKVIAAIKSQVAFPAP